MVGWSRFLVVSCLVGAAGAAGAGVLGCSSPDGVSVRPGEDGGAVDGVSGRPEGVALCYTSFSSRHPATSAFWNAFRAGNVADRPAVIASLAAASLTNPAEEELALLSGLANLWRVAEPLPEEVNDQAGLIVAALAARGALEQAYALCPTDHRIAAWLGPILVNLGRAMSQPAIVDQGMQVLRQGIDSYAAFVLFAKLLVYADRPKTDADFQLALAAVEANAGACTKSDPACGNHPRAAHNIEGSMVFVGDAYAKAGQKERALLSYRQAMSATTYPDWGYQSLLGERIATLDARVAAFDSPDTSDDPVSAWNDTNQCSICHRR
jgi:hypothetical protein